MQKELSPLHMLRDNWAARDQHIRLPDSCTVMFCGRQRTQLEIELSDYLIWDHCAAAFHGARLFSPRKPMVRTV